MIFVYTGRRFEEMATTGTQKRFRCQDDFIGFSLRGRGESRMPLIIYLLESQHTYVTRVRIYFSYLRLRYLNVPGVRWYYVLRIRSPTY